MPLEEIIVDGGRVLIRFFVHVILEFFLDTVCRTLGYWTLRLFSFGRYEPDEDGWLTAVTGLLVLGLLIWAGLTWV